MKNKVLLIVVVLVLSLACQLHAKPDYYYGDAAVYTGTSSEARPNIMFLIDNSGAMKDMGSVEPYDPSVDYSVGMAVPYPREQVYLRNVANENNTNYQEVSFTVDEIECSRITDNEGSGSWQTSFYGIDSDGVEVTDYADTDGDDTYHRANPDGDGFDDDSGETHPRYALEQNGFWYGALHSQGYCPNNQNQFENYFTGNFRNYLENVAVATTWAANTPYAMGDLVEESSAVEGLILKCVGAGTSGGTALDWDNMVTGTIFTDGTVSWEVLGTVMDMVQYQMEHVVFDQVRELANMGMMTFGDNNHGGKIIVPVVKAGLNDTGGPDNYDDLVAGLTVLEDLVNGNTQPVNESMWDAYLYWIGEADSSDGIASDSAAYDSPIEHWCQSNHLVILTTGSAGNNSQTKTKVRTESGEDSGDLTGDGHEGLADDVAALLYDYLNYDIDGFTPKVNTHIIQMMTPEVERLKTAAETYGHGIYRNINNPGELIEALTDIITGILEEDSSFVAPVVPASPENRAYSGQRIYLGFFKPMEDEPWYGNLKKFGLNYYSQITAFNGSGDTVLATDSDGYFLTDGDGNPTIASFWFVDANGDNVPDDLDGGWVDDGGVAEILKGNVASRNIYTIADTASPETDLNADENLFKVNTDGSPNISAATLDVADDATAVKTINFIRGYDAFGDAGGATTDVRPWVMGDIMHSKPVVLNYANYTFTEANEADSAVNKAYIFVGANDGMLHAFRDSTGEEAWAFIPPDLLPNLQYIRDTDHHYYFVDNSPTIYVYDEDNDGTIETGGTNQDKAILICGMRRGGGTSTITSGPSGSYFAIDISNPEDPQYMWSINSDTTDYGEMGQTWSLPRLTKVRDGSASKVVVVVGAGYDTNEDLRYGQNQQYPSTDANTITSLASQGAEGVTSAGTSDPYLPSGRGIFMIELASLSSTDGSPDFTNSGDLVWSYTYDDDSNMTYSIPSDPLVIDRDSDGYTDHVYVGDTGGQLWRFNINGSDTTNWTGTRIFTANVSTSSDNGRKIFFKPTATIMGYDTFLYFGTGDREHPLNTAVADRFYVVRDRQKPSPSASDHVWDYAVDGPLTESKLVDLTEDQLQDSSVSGTVKETLRDKLSYPDYTDNPDNDTSNSDTYYGWYIKLVNPEIDDNGDEIQAKYGEKVLSVPKVFNNVLYFTTYTPITPSDADDPCAGQLGPSLLYAVTADTAEAVYNFYEGNDTVDDETGETTPVLARQDRALNVGDGIASEPLIMVNSKGAVSVMVGRGGGFFNTGAVGEVDPVFPLYWMKW
ncbi:type IV pilus assembly protein PilY1 [Malonomonas rubra DSM 5091]|uniref:Type IV pilus assembly protein PilY1 n=1 Tax=Malonomonas rubra DSM 5091 TaxID=1122189 RepID=A0A1M6BL40_MALRU|nr:PilC/PilY family type IV pilus protein [Malonomonas rubra]SHI49510.1 type IV pilus assembly protein PilY1 [Malonomonas rubra DSM 5091]